LADIIPANSSTTESLALNGTITGLVDTPGDHDWYRVSLTAGQTYTFLLNGTGAGALEDPYLKLFNAGGTLLRQNDDSGVGRNAKLVFTAPTSGTYYIDAGAWDLTSENPPETNLYAGGYMLSMQLWTAPTVWTNDQIANQLINGYWQEYEASARHFNVTQGGTITYNIEGLTAAGRNLATAALAQWSDIIGVTFTRVTTADAQITFDDNSTEIEAHATSTVSGGFITHSDVLVSTSWLTQSGTGLNSYSFQTYIHEIGHALGLGHAGNYNVTADFQTDALYANDGWPSSVMSYFSVNEGAYFSNYTYDYTVTPMVADVLAMQQMYGLSTTTRTGDTTYGFNSNAGRDVYNAALYSTVAYTIFDSGGTDTLDYSGFWQSQTINLNPETFFNVGGRVGNVVIARGTVIENAIGGSGNDVIVGNGAANTLTGGGGNDRIDGGAGDDRIIYDAADTAANVTGGSGTDTLVINNIVSPWTYNLAGGSFERAERLQHDSGANNWTTITSIYNQSWQMTAQDTRYDNGTRAWANFDVANTENWKQVWFNYDVQGRMVTADLFRDDGGHNWIQYDVLNQQNWNELYFIFDAQNRVANHDIRYDDGTRGWSNLDVNNTQSWSQSWLTYDAQGRLVSQETRNDDGTRVWGSIDATNTMNWAEAWYGFDAQNRMTSLDVDFDNGTRRWTGYDAANSQAWASNAYFYDASGRLYQQVTTWDDGHTSTTLF